MTVAETPVDLDPGSKDWYRYMTASKVAAVLGVSRWESPLSLWLKMHGDVEPEPMTDVQARGHYLEPAVLNWWLDRHPGFEWDPDSGTTLFSDRLPWAAAKPDGIATDGWITDPVEAKTAANDDEWGMPGTDEIPLDYAAQCMWSMHVGGFGRIFVPVLTERLEFREYVVTYDAAIATHIEQICREFMESLRADVRPELDASVATYESLRRFNPLIEKKTRVEISEDLARQFIDAVAANREAEAGWNLARSAMTDAMGTKHKAYYAGALIATRQNSSSGTPYPKAPKDLPELPQRTAA